MDAGLERTGRFTTVACVEKEAPFCDTLEANRRAGRLGSADTAIFRGSIDGLEPEEVLEACGLRPGELDVLSGGPPCQTFSTAGRRGTLQDPRGMLLWQFLKYVEVLQPKYFVMENVRGLLSAGIQHRPIHLRPGKGGPPLRPEEEPGSVVALWVDDLRKATDGAYRVDCFEVNAVNYGAPQLRERVLLIGNRVGRVVDFPEPTHGNGHQPTSAQASLLDDVALTPYATLGDALDSVVDDDGDVMDFSPRKKEFLSLVPEGSNWRSLPEPLQRESMGRAFHAKGGRSGWWRRLSRGLPSPTVVTMPNHASTSMCHPSETRALTLKECAAIQGFPASWEFHGTTAQKYTQVGNALPVKLAELAGEVLAAQLDDEGDADPASAEMPAYRRVYLKSHVRTRQWFKAGVTYAWRDGEDNSAAHYSAVGIGRKRA